MRARHLRAGVPAFIAALGMQACDNVQRSMVFMTGTMIGIDAAIQPQGDSPVHVTLGYKRAEVLFDPIMEDCTDATGGKTTYKIKDQPHSVMAKLLGDSKTLAKSGAGPEASVSASIGQWFASGKAAEIIAANGGAAALTDDPKVANAVAAASKGFGAGLKEKERGIIPQVIDAIRQTLQGLVRGGDAEAARLDADLDRVADDVALPQTYPFTKYVRLAAQPTNVVVDPPVPANGNVPHDLSGVTAYHGWLRSSVTDLESILNPHKIDPTLLRLPNGKTFADLKNELALQTVLLKDMESRIATNERLRRASEYVYAKLSGTDEKR